MDIDYTPEKVARLGSAIASVNLGERIGVAGCEGIVSESVRYALMSGLISGGAQIWNFGECFVSQFKFLMSFCSLELGAYICNEKREPVKLYGEYGTILPEYIEDEIKEKYIKGECGVCCEKEYKRAYDMSSMQYAYDREMAKTLGGNADGVCVTIKCSDLMIKESVDAVIERFGGKIGGNTVFRISATGLSVSAYEQNGSYASFENLLAICCNDEMKKGRDLVLPYDSPEIIGKLAEKYGRKVKKYATSPINRSDLNVRCEGAKQYWSVDGVIMTLKIIGIMAQRNMTLGELLKEIPEFAVVKKSFCLNGVKLERVERNYISNTLPQKEGLALFTSNARAIIKADRDKNKLNILAEAVNNEAASELCDDIYFSLKNTSLDNTGDKE